MTLTKNTKHLIALAVATLLFSMVIGIHQAKANPSFFATESSTATATSTVVYMRPGVATTTLYYDAYADFSNAKADGAVLGVQMTGSSTLSSLLIQYEYAFNNPNANCVTTPTACDWYKDSLFGFQAEVSTTSSAINLGTINTHTLPFASSTLNGAAGTASRTTRVFTVPTVTRYVRAVITVPIGASNSAMWATLRPSKEMPE